MSFRTCAARGDLAKINYREDASGESDVHPKGMLVIYGVLLEHEYGVMATAR